MSAVLSSVEAEFRRYKALADSAMGQLSETELNEPETGSDNSITVITWHVGGNLASRFTDFLTTDGEKPWRKRDGEFASRTPSRAELADHWERGWGILFDTLSALSDDDLQSTVTIRGNPLAVHAALHRALAHISYHVGQIVYRAKALRGDAWENLSVPPGGSVAYNKNPSIETGDAHAARLENPPEK